jgi:type I site-specific restriction endonuclease
MSGKDEADNPKPYFGEYPTDYFDFIIIDECHEQFPSNLKCNSGFPCASG